MLPVYETDPFSDARWDALVMNHPLGGIFHSREWLQAIHATYGYRPFVITTSAPDAPLTNGILLCEVKSILTGRRLVSVPFSDHCDPLTNSSEELASLISYLRTLQQHDKYSYVELRPFLADCALVSGRELQPGEAFIGHLLNLDLPLEQLLGNTQKDSVQRKIRNAERDQLGYAEGRGGALVSQFFELMLKTRRRHALPPQPIEWFRNLANCLGEHMQIRVAYVGEAPIAAILNLTFKQTLTYKYSCSDEKFRNRGGTAFLIWKSIVEETAKGRKVLDFGRSDPDNDGLLKFKDRFGSQRVNMQYWRISDRRAKHGESRTWLKSAVKHAITKLPDSVLTATGRILYRHMG